MGGGDYFSAPFNGQWLRAKTCIAPRWVDVQTDPPQRVVNLEGALARVGILPGLVLAWFYCKKIRSDSNYWQKVEAYVRVHWPAAFSETPVKPQLAKVQEGT